MRWFYLGLRVCLTMGVLSAVILALLGHSLLFSAEAGVCAGVVTAVAATLWTAVRVKGAGGSLSPHQDVNVNLLEPIDAVRTRARGVLTEMRADVTDDGSAHRLTARTPVSWRSWGEIVTVGFESDGSSTGVQIASRPRLPRTGADYGHGRELVERIAHRLQAAP